ARPRARRRCVAGERPMKNPDFDHNGRPWYKGRRGVALAAGLGATLALSPFVWAETTISPVTPSATIPPTTMPSMPQQSFAPLVKRVLPAVVNISVTEKPNTDQMSDESFDNGTGNNSPFDQFLRRFFEQNGRSGQLGPHEFGGQPNDNDND